MTGCALWVLPKGKVDEGIRLQYPRETMYTLLYGQHRAEYGIDLGCEHPFPQFSPLVVVSGDYFLTATFCPLQYR